jgi:S1-C subfamily serine protease
MTRSALLSTGVVLWLAAVAATPAAATSAAAAPEAASGRLEARVAIVLADLTIRPAPKQRFVIVNAGAPATGPEGGAPLAIVTGFDGTIGLPLPPGRWRIRSEAPVEIEGKRFSWDVGFEITAGAATTVELSNDNARIETAPSAPAPARGLDAGALYERYRQGVFKIISDEGHGSGFLVAPEGLIITNHHVIDGAAYLAAKIDERHKHAVVVLADDADHDVAVLRIHPDTIRGLPVLPLADDRPDRVPVSVGDHVVAIGSPLTTETTLTEGVVSKIQDDKIYSDVNINPGNSGGPLLDRRGDVVGINTFGIGTGEGPGLSGINRIHVAGAALATARDKLKGTEPPSPRSLPVESTYRFDPAVIKKEALASEHKLEDYRVQAGKFSLVVLTPVLAAAEVLRDDQEAAQAHSKRRKEAEPSGAAAAEGEKFYAWQKDDENFRPVVLLRAFPEVKRTAGSAFKMSMLGRGGKYQFKADFDRMELRRGADVIEPILPGRIKEVINVSGPAATLKDILYWGLYEYPPEAFRPGSSLVLRIWEQGAPDPEVIDLPAALLARIQQDYRPYLTAVAHE